MDKFDIVVFDELVALSLAACTFISGLIDPPKEDTRNVSKLEKRFDAFLCTGLTCVIMFVFITTVLPLAIRIIG